MSTANGPDWAFGNPIGELFVTLGSALTLATIAIPQQSTGWAPSSHTKHNPTIGRISDFTGNVWGTGIAMLGGYGLEVTYYSQNGADKPWLRALRTSLIEAEAVAATAGITFGLKSLTGRCRPRAYSNGACLDGQSDAFPSGHTSSIAAVAGVRLVNAIASKGKSGARYASFALAEAASIATGALRMGAGAHSWEDVAVGWGIGHLTGAAFALMHKWLPVPAAATTVPIQELPGAAHATELPLGTPRGPTFGGSWTFHF
jgi:membrane-associated phospholipid phosphatase